MKLVLNRVKPPENSCLPLHFITNFYVNFSKATTIFSEVKIEKPVHIHLVSDKGSTFADSKSAPFEHLNLCLRQCSLKCIKGDMIRIEKHLSKLRKLNKQKNIDIITDSNLTESLILTKGVQAP